MKWFKNNKIKPSILPSFLEKIMIKINHQLIKWANYLKVRMDSYSIQKQKIVLLLFCLLFGCSSILVLWNGFQTKHFTSFETSHIKVVTLLPTSRPMRPFLSIPELKRIHFLKNYLDSLSLATNGKQLKDSLLFYRPHLMDSLTYLDHLYSENFKNETNGK